MQPAVMLMLALGGWSLVCLGCALALVWQERRHGRSA